MTVSFWQQTAARRRLLECDVCIIGAGITGACAALWVRRFAPRLNVLIVEARAAGSGASGRNAGMVLAGLAEHYDRMCEVYGRATAREIWSVTLEHQRLLREFLDETRADIDFDPCGSWRLGFAPEERERLEHSFELLREDGFDAEFRRGDPLERDFYGALGISSDAGLHSMKLVRAVIEASGAEILTGNEVAAIESEAGGAVLIKTNETDIRAAHAFIALNAYAPLVVDYFRALVEPHRGQILVTAPLAKRILERLVYTNDGYIYFRQLPDKRFLLGGWRHEFAADEAGYMDATSEDVQRALERFMHERFPETKDVKIEARWAGTMGFSPDGLPLVGTLPDFGGRIAYAVGFTGHGFGLAFDVARRAAKSLLNGEKAGIFDVSRLERKNS